MKRWNGSSWVDITTAKRWDGSSWTDMGTVIGGLSAVVSSANAGGSGGDENSPSFITITTSPATVVTSTGGSGAGPTYAWTRLSGSPVIYADSPTSATTTFSGELGLSSTKQATMRCTVTRGSDTVTVDVFVTLQNVGKRPGEVPL